MSMKSLTLFVLLFAFVACFTLGCNLGETFDEDLSFPPNPIDLDSIKLTLDFNFKNIQIISSNLPEIRSFKLCQTRYNSYLFYYDGFNIYYFIGGEGMWTNSIRLFPMREGYFDVCVDPYDIIHLVWVDNENKGNNALYYAYMNENKWSKAVSLKKISYSSGVTISSYEDSLNVIYSDANKELPSLFSSSQYSKLYMLTSKNYFDSFVFSPINRAGLYSARFHNAKFSNDGMLHLLWSDTRDNKNSLVYKQKGSNWRNDIILSNRFYGHTSRIALLPQGEEDLITAWVDEDSIVARELNNGDWDYPYIIMTKLAPSFGSNVQIIRKDGGVVFIACGQSSLYAIGHNNNLWTKQIKIKEGIKFDYDKIKDIYALPDNYDPSITDIILLGRDLSAWKFYLVKYEIKIKETEN